MRLHRLAFAALLVHASSALAAPTTLGIEAEIKDFGIDLTDATALRAWGTPTYLGGDKEIEPRILCTKDPSTVDGDYPLVSFTYDMWTQAYVKHHSRRLEIVTGPIESSNDDEWKRALGAVQAYFRAFERLCKEPSRRTTYTRKNKSEEKEVAVCAVTVADLVEELGPGFTTRCYTTPSRNFDATYADKVKLIGKLDGAGVPMSIDGVQGAGVQMSVAVDVEKFADDRIADLYGSQAKLLRAFGKSGIKYRLGAATPEEIGFATIYYTAFLDYYAYFAGKFDDDELGKRVDGYTITDDPDYALKNKFTLFPKASMADIYQLIVSRSPAFADKLAGLAPYELCSELEKALGSGLDDDERCVALYRDAWAPRVKGKVDPMSLAEIAHPIAPWIANDKVRVVFEMRGVLAAELRKQRTMTAKRDSDGNLELSWERASIELPAILK
ncbi:MAG TPA: hypothetical protein VL463_01775 [Kofleriaceae bacterium]|nr:hypothetical protein [Kofleriaceae bacterium]